MMTESEDILIVEYYMMDQKKYTPLVLCSSVGFRTFLYPLNLVRTRLQVQRGHSIYNGTFDAFVKISRNEGIAGLYRGLPVHLLQIPGSFVYIHTYEKTRSYLESSKNLSNTYVRSFIGGGLASLVSQTIAVPVDIVSQHMQLLGQRKAKASDKVEKKLHSLQRLHLSDEIRHSRFGPVMAIVSKIYELDGLRGFYRGYLVSLSVFVPSSACWWSFYNKYSELFSPIFPDWFPRIGTQGFSAVCGGITTAMLTNPLDVFRTRIQVEGMDFFRMLAVLRQEKQWYLKGLSARVLSSIMFSLVVSISYEIVKKLSVKEEYRDRIKW